jgi:hypothetical protein
MQLRSKSRRHFSESTDGARMTRGNAASVEVAASHRRRRRNRRRRASGNAASVEVAASLAQSSPLRSPPSVAMQLRSKSRRHMTLPGWNDVIDRVAMQLRSKSRRHRNTAVRDACASLVAMQLRSKSRRHTPYAPAWRHPQTEWQCSFGRSRGVTPRGEPVGLGSQPGGNAASVEVAASLARRHRQLDLGEVAIQLRSKSQRHSRGRSWRDGRRGWQCSFGRSRGVTWWDRSRSADVTVSRHAALGAMQPQTCLIAGVTRPGSAEHRAVQCSYDRDRESLACDAGQLRSKARRHHGVVLTREELDQPEAPVVAQADRWH